MSSRVMASESSLATSGSGLIQTRLSPIFSSDAAKRLSVYNTSTWALITQQAIDAYGQVVKIKPDYAQGWFKIGFAYLSLKNFNEAIKAFQQVIKIEPNNSDAFYGLGFAYYSIGNRQAAENQYTSLIKLDLQKAEMLKSLLNK